MRGVCTSYTSFFNKKYERIGPLFQDRYKASHINRNDYLLHISRYIHRNPKNYEQWPYSSYSYYAGQKKASWLKPVRVMELFNNKDEYVKFMADYDDYKNSLDDISSEIADS